MKFIDRTVPNLDDFLALPMESVAWLVLQELRPSHRTQEKNGTRLIDYVAMPYQGYVAENHLYRGERRDDVQLVLAEAWGWLEANGLLAPHPLAGERWILTRRAREIVAEMAFDDYRKASSVPWDVIHPLIRDLVRTLILSGLYDSAILEAFKRVEVAVREACGYRASKDSIGTTLMNNAFRTANSSSEKNRIGRLTDVSVEESEQQALRDLFAGSMGYLKNPQSHRIVGVDEVTQTIEVIMFASHLLRIVDMRKDAWDRAISEQVDQEQCSGKGNESMKDRY